MPKGSDRTRKCRQQPIDISRRAAAAKNGESELDEPNRERVSRRALVVGLCSLAVFVAYTDRVNVSVAAVAMKEQFGWTQTQKGFVLSSFFIGYITFMFASSVLATRYGGRRSSASPSSRGPRSRS